MKPISEFILLEAEAAASMPVKTPTDQTVPIYSAVADLIAARRVNGDGGAAWGRLRTILDQSVADGSLDAFDQLARAWGKLIKLNVNAITVTINQGDKTDVLIDGAIKNPPRRPITVFLIDAIRRCQHKNNRAPTRPEILDEMGKLDPNRDTAIDETELSRQLTKLGWNDLIPAAGELAS